MSLNFFKDLLYIDSRIAVCAKEQARAKDPPITVGQVLENETLHEQVNKGRNREQDSIN
jgi:hypothetical protein